MTAPVLPTRLAAATRELHQRAERSGLMRELLQGTLARSDYLQLLRDLHAVYGALEPALDRQANLPAVAAIRLPGLARMPALAEDLDALAGDDWRSWPASASAAGYAAHLERLAATAPALLVAHAYVRYLGDLSGGQMLRDIVRRAFALDGSAGTAFYDFSPLDVVAARQAFRAGLAALPVDAVTADAIVAETRAAFVRHIEWFEAGGRGAAGAGAPAR
jgi:heme oxygenase